MDAFGFGDRWIYRAGDRSLGMPLPDFRDLCSQADLLVWRSEPIRWWRPEYGWPRRRVFIDTDPGFTQFNLANGEPHLALTVERCERLFTIGWRIGEGDHRIPACGRQWHHTVFPVSLPDWPVAENNCATHFTSVMQWRSYADVSYDGVTYGNKDREFPKFLDLPRRTSQPLLLALTGGTPDELTGHGWQLCVGWRATRTAEAYREWVQTSRGELSVAKHGYVASRAGWFGDRSTCYLASGRPVLVQDTGQRDWLPTGKGIVTFRDLDEAVAGLESINAGYRTHRSAARALAEQYFDAALVLPRFLDQAMS
jgi:hypothetical protein